MSWRVDVQGEVGALALDVEIVGSQRPVALVGPNAAGKTSVLRMIAGAVRPRTGEIVVDGARLFGSCDGVCMPPEHRRVGYVPQGYGLFPHLDVTDNVAFGLRQTLARAEARSRAAEVLRRLDAGHLADRDTRRLSGGERQRVALARALARSPRMLLLDEPLAALDATARRSVRAFLVERLSLVEIPTLVVTHDVRDVVALDATVFVLFDGRIVQSGRIEELRASPANAFVEEFVGAQ